MIQGKSNGVCRIPQGTSSPSPFPGRGMEGVSEGRDISFFPRELMLAMEHHGMRRASGAKKVPGDILEPLPSRLMTWADQEEVSWSEWKLLYSVDI